MLPNIFLPHCITIPRTQIFERTTYLKRMNEILVKLGTFIINILRNTKQTVLNSWELLRWKCIHFKKKFLNNIV